ncbi:hypothetical protein LguiB_021059 [Lonicera macranthoides]
MLSKTIHVILTEVTTTSTTKVKETSIDDLPVEVVRTTSTTKVKETSIDDLPVEVVSLIGSSLFARDRACFRTVCKTWRYSIPPAPRSVQLDEMVKFPHMHMGYEGSLCRFYHPILNTTYALTMPNNSKIRYSKDGNLATFDPKHSAWAVLIKPEKPCTKIRRNYLVDCDGDLISVFEGHVGNAIEIFKMDYSAMAWRKAKSLGDKTLFVSTTGYTTSQVVGMENTIYFPRFHKNSSVFYSLNTSKFHTLGSGYNCDDFYGTMSRTDSTWFEPSFDKCPKDFRWWSIL